MKNKVFLLYLLQKTAETNEVRGFQKFIFLFVVLAAVSFLLKDNFYKKNSLFFSKMPILFGKKLEQEIKTKVRSEVLDGKFSRYIELSPEQRFEVTYTLDWEMQNFVRDYFEMYEPDFGSLVLMDAETGDVLVTYSYQHPKVPKVEGVHNLALQAAVPAASIFKIVTAGASLDLGRISANSMLPINGSHHTLYKKNVFSNQINRWTQFISLRQAFARSVNSAFAKIGLQTMLPAQLEDYSKRFGFNRPIETDIEALPSPSSVQIDPNDNWRIAAVSSGFDHNSRMSGLHGALLASVAVNNGLFVKPRFIKSVTERGGREIIATPVDIESVVINRKAADELRDLMQETVENGTSRRSFRRVAGLRSIDELEMGGKTGSLDSRELKGRCDWFVGYAKGEGFKIAIAALTVNQQKWKVKSSYLAGKIIEHYYRKMQNSNIHTQQASQENRLKRAEDL